ncbi:MAG: class I SAM-dependent methyltransferase [Planctomycetes bacterium]|nr:class I SAM-dependent methyltransferase [Planctomycetota bacterium]
MITLHADGRTDGSFPEEFSYCHGWNPLTRAVLPCTRYLRARNAAYYLGDRVERHLDIGCGDGYFLKRSPARERCGLDALIGDSLQDLDRIPAGHFDRVTMLAVVEHLEDPTALLRHVWRVIAPNGKLILTTPKQAADKFIRWYVPNIEEEHEHYFDRESLERILAPAFVLTGYHTFLLGLNQAFCFAPKPSFASALCNA